MTVERGQRRAVRRVWLKYIITRQEKMLIVWNEERRVETAAEGHRGRGGEAGLRSTSKSRET